MDEVVAYSTLALTVTLAVSRPRIGLRGLRFTPGAAALLGVTLLVLGGLLRLDDVVASARVQWRPLIALTSIMVITGAVHEVGVFQRAVAMLESHARRTSAVRAFGLVFLASVVTPAMLNNDAAILLLTPLVVALARRLYPSRPGMAEAFAFAVFLAPGVAPLVISNPMNMIVAEFAGVGFNSYAAVMAPISAAGAVLTYVVLRVCFRRELRSAVARPGPIVVPPAHPGERPVAALLGAVLLAYPVLASVRCPIWPVAAAGAVGCVALCNRYHIAPVRRVLGHVSVDTLLFLWGVLLVIVGLRHVGIVDQLATLYRAAPEGSDAQVGLVGTIAALGSALVDNHPMAMLNMMALGEHGASRSLLAALVGGDIGPRLLPIGSLAGLLWMHLLRREGVAVPVSRFVRVGALVLVPTLAVSLAMLAMLAAR